MEQKQSFHLKAHGFGLNDVSIFYLLIIFIVFTFLWLLVIMPLSYFFPLLFGQNWVSVVPWCMVFFIFNAHVFASYFTVTLDEKEIRLLWLHIPIYKIPIPNLKLFCAVGNGRENMLCLTTHSIEEMALRQEKKLLKNYFTRSDVHFIKKKSNWQDILAQQYLNGLRKSPWGVFKDHAVIFFDMQSVLQKLIRSLYPQLPYKNYTEIHPGSPEYNLPQDKAPCFSLGLAYYYVHIQKDGILLSTKRKTVSHIPAERIKAIVRVDIFKNYERCTPDHAPILFVSTETATELAAKAPQRLYGETTDAFSNSQALLCCAYATRAARRWTIKHQDCCPLPCTQANVTQLRSCYPHAEWIDLSDSWIKGDEI